MINVIDTEIEGVKIIEPRLFGDARGYFFESFSQREFEEKVCKTQFVQDNESMSVAGVVRGLHFQKPPFTQAKLVRVVKGEVLDVAVDNRVGGKRSSFLPTFVFRPLTPPYVPFGIRRFLFWIPFEIRIRKT